MDSQLIFSILCIWVGTALYTLAAYLHLTLKNWTFTRAYMLAIPLVLIEYIFSIYGNKYAMISGLSMNQIILITIGFYVMNVWSFNAIIQKRGIEIRDVIAFCFVAFGILISTGVVLQKM